MINPDQSVQQTPTDPPQPDPTQLPSSKPKEELTDLAIDSLIKQFTRLGIKPEEITYDGSKFVIQSLQKGEKVQEVSIHLHSLICAISGLSKRPHGLVMTFTSAEIIVTNVVEERVDAKTGKSTAKKSNKRDFIICFHSDVELKNSPEVLKKYQDIDLESQNKGMASKFTIEPLVFRKLIFKFSQDYKMKWQIENDLICDTPTIGHLILHSFELELVLSDTTKGTSEKTLQFTMKTSKLEYSGNMVKLFVTLEETLSESFKIYALEVSATTKASAGAFIPSVVGTISIANIDFSRPEIIQSGPQAVFSSTLIGTQIELFMETSNSRIRYTIDSGTTLSKGKKILHLSNLVYSEVNRHKELNLRDGWTNMTSLSSLSSILSKSDQIDRIHVLSAVLCPTINSFYSIVKGCNINIGKLSLGADNGVEFALEEIKKEKAVASAGSNKKKEEADGNKHSDSLEVSTLQIFRRQESGGSEQSKKIDSKLVLLAKSIGTYQTPKFVPTRADIYSKLHDYGHSTLEDPNTPLFQTKPSQEGSENSNESGAKEVSDFYRYTLKIPKLVIEPTDYFNLDNEDQPYPGLAENGERFSFIATLKELFFELAVLFSFEISTIQMITSHKTSTSLEVFSNVEEVDLVAPTHSDDSEEEFQPIKENSNDSKEKKLFNSRKTEPKDFFISYLYGIHMYKHFSQIQLEISKLLIFTEKNILEENLYKVITQGFCEEKNVVGEQYKEYYWNYDVLRNLLVIQLIKKPKLLAYSQYIEDWIIAVNSMHQSGSTSLDPDLVFHHPKLKLSKLAICNTEFSMQDSLISTLQLRPLGIVQLKLSNCMLISTLTTPNHFTRKVLLLRSRIEYNRNSEKWTHIFDKIFSTGTASKQFFDDYASEEYYCSHTDISRLFVLHLTSKLEDFEVHALSSHLFKSMKEADSPDLSSLGFTEVARFSNHYYLGSELNRSACKNVKERVKDIEMESTEEVVVSGTLATILGILPVVFTEATLLSQQELLEWANIPPKDNPLEINVDIEEFSSLDESIFGQMSTHTQRLKFARLRKKTLYKQIRIRIFSGLDYQRSRLSFNDLNSLKTLLEYKGEDANSSLKQSVNLAETSVASSIYQFPKLLENQRDKEFIEILFSSVKKESYLDCTERRQYSYLELGKVRVDGSFGQQGTILLLDIDYISIKGEKCRQVDRDKSPTLQISLTTSCSDVTVQITKHLDAFFERVLRTFDPKTPSENALHLFAMRFLDTFFGELGSYESYKVPTEVSLSWQEMNVNWSNREKGIQGNLRVPSGEQSNSKLKNSLFEIYNTNILPAVSAANPKLSLERQIKDYPKLWMVYQSAFALKKITDSADTPTLSEISSKGKGLFKALWGNK